MRIPFQIDPSTPYSDVESEEERKEAEGVVNSVEISNYVHLPVVDIETVIANERARYYDRFGNSQKINIFHKQF